jgi:hypothetical protein
MKNDSTLKKFVLTSVDKIFAFINILKIVSKISEFRRWLKKYHKIENDEDIFDGYKFFLITSLKCFINAIVKDETLGLKEDYTFFRANFVGEMLGDIPNTCEKIIFIKNVWTLSRKIRKSRNWKELKDGLKDLKKLFIIFDKFYNNVVSVKNIDKKESLKIVTELYTCIFLNDAQHGCPHGSLFPSIIELPISEEYLKRSFKGYVYSLQYLWFNLLGASKFENSCLRNLHKASELYSKEAEDYIDLEIGIPVSEEEIKKEFIKEKFSKDQKLDDDLVEVEPLSKEDLKKLNKEKEKLLQIKDWFALDRFFGEVWDEIIEPIRKKLKVNLGFDPLLTIKKVNKSFYQDLLSRDNIKEPEYLNKKDKESIKKQLDYHLLWYKLNVLDTQKLDVFNGVPAFISALIGSVELNKYYNNKEKVLVRIFKHPALSIEKCDYSFAILIQAFGGISDYSGWLVFFDCATDYSGFGGSLYAMAENFIKQLKENGSIEIKEILVDKSIFKEYLTERSVSSTFDKIIFQTPLGRFDQLSISEIQNRTQIFAEAIKGKFFEYVFYKWIKENKQYDDTRCDFLLDGEQIDCIGEIENRIDVFECKLNLHINEINKTIEQIKRKVKIIKDKNRESTVIPYIVTYCKIPPNRKSKFEKKGINFIDNFEETIKNDRLFNGIRKGILNILNFEFSKIF